MSDLSLATQLERTQKAFAQRFGRPATIAAVAPGRVNLIGEHTDYNDGFVLPMAIDRQSVVLLAPRDDRHAYLASTAFAEVVTFPVDIDGTTIKHADIANDPSHWSRYLRGVIAFSYTPQGFDLLLDSNVPLGAGLSSSASLEVGTATALEALGGYTMNPVNKALFCVMAEHRFAGAPCGIMDQFISAMGQAGNALLIDCRSKAFEPVPVNPDEVAILIVDSHCPHELSGGEYADRRNACEQAAKTLGVKALRDADLPTLNTKQEAMPEVVYRRAKHIITENDRVLLAVDALKKGRYATMGDLMVASHVSMRDDFEITTPKLDKLVDIACNLPRELGVYGSRMTGGGFGGCTVTLVKADQADAACQAIVSQYREHCGIDAPAFVTTPAAGARVLSQD